MNKDDSFKIYNSIKNQNNFEIGDLSPKSLNNNYKPTHRNLKLNLNCDKNI